MMAAPGATELYPAPHYHEDEARTKLCPLLSSRNSDESLNRVNCEASACALWHSILDKDKTGATNFRGYGCCSIPRRAVEFARAEAEKGRAA